MQYANFSKSAYCGEKGLACLRNQSTAILQNANNEEIAKAPYGQFQYGPAIDGTYVQNLPGIELLKGRFAKGVKLMIGHNRLSPIIEINCSDEGFFFANPKIETNEEVDRWIKSSFPDAKASIIDAITNFWYPWAPVWDRYWVPFTRLEDIIAGFCLYQYLG